MRRAHAMPFGAEARAGGARFRLWAPGAATVELVLGGERAPIAMAAQGEGWYEARVAQSPPGTRYAYRIDGAREVPDPASRWNPDGVHAPCAVVVPLAYPWRDGHWRGRPWEEAVVYELHVGAFTPAGSFAGVAERLRYLAELGVTALELMPVAAFAGRRNWGYDGVLPFAPAAAYGEPDDLRRLVDSAHAHGLMVLLDVVYNHFGPEGNYLHAYAPQFFDPRRATPWGAALDFDAQRRRPVRDFFIHNALYWLEEFHLDGLRLDAVHAIADDSQPHIVAEIAQRVRQRYDGEREVHLVLENDRNEAGLLRRDAGGRPLLATAQWNEDLHHALHVIATGEADGYYGDYAASPVASLGRALAEGFVYQGEPSAYRGGAPRGEASAGLPAGAFVAFAQNHDQIGNRALGERLAALAAADAVHAVTACAWLAPSPPLLFMGEEFGASTPFLFFCDFHGELAAAVTRGRRDEFARFAAFADARAREAIPDPNAEATFLASRLDWREAESAQGRENLERCRRWLELRRRHVLPFARDAAGGRWQVHGERVLRVAWSGRGGRALHLLANLSPRTAAGVTAPSGERVFATDGLALAPGTSGELPPFGVALFVEVTR